MKHDLLEVKRFCGRKHIVGDMTILDCVSGFCGVVSSKTNTLDNIRCLGSVPRRQTLQSHRSLDTLFGTVGDIEKRLIHHIGKEISKPSMQIALFALRMHTTLWWHGSLRYTMDRSRSPDTSTERSHKLLNKYSKMFQHLAQHYTSLIQTYLSFAVIGQFLIRLGLLILMALYLYTPMERPYYQRLMPIHWSLILQRDNNGSVQTVTNFMLFCIAILQELEMIVARNPSPDWCLRLLDRRDLLVVLRCYIEDICVTLKTSIDAKNEAFADFRSALDEFEELLDNQLGELKHILIDDKISIWSPLQLLLRVAFNEREEPWKFGKRQWLRNDARMLIHGCR